MSASPACCSCCPCCRPTATGRAPSWPAGSRSATARCAATSTGCATSATRCTPSAGAAGGYQLQAGAAMPPLLLDDEEAVAIVVGLRAAAGGMVEGIEETSVRALSKVVQVMPPRLRRRVDALASYTVPAVFGGRGPTIDAGRAGHARPGLPRRRAVRFGYRTRDGEAWSVGRAAPAGLGRPPVVPRRLGPHPARLAQLPAGPDERRRRPPACGSGSASCPVATRRSS